MLITPSTGTVNAPVSCGGTGSPATSQTVSGTCLPNISTSDNGASVTFTATPAVGSTFGGWSAATNLSPSTCTGTTNPCSAVLGSNPTLTVTFNAAAVNQPPVNSVPGPQSTNEDTAKVFSTGTANLISISDPDAGGATVQQTLTATNGTVTLSTTAGLAFSGGGDGTADATMTFQGTIAAINTALNGLTFSPTADFNGAASLQVVTNDLGNTGTAEPRRTPTRSRSRSTPSTTRRSTRVPGRSVHQRGHRQGVLHRQRQPHLDLRPRCRRRHRAADPDGDQRHRSR